MMLSQLRASGWQVVMTRELPALAFALVVAEVWFKFGSFSLEALAFLAVWYATSAALGGAAALVRKAARRANDAAASDRSDR
jgi:hypothetical protein